MLMLPKKLCLSFSISLTLAAKMSAALFSFSVFAVTFDGKNWQCSIWFLKPDSVFHFGLG